MQKGKSVELSERGATLVELSIALTVLLVAMFAVIEFGRASGSTMLLLTPPDVERDMPFSTPLIALPRLKT